MRISRQSESRAGVVLAEAAVVGFIFLMLMLLMFEIGICVFRQFTLSQAARYGARIAIVHGVYAPTVTTPANQAFTGPWGPTTVTTYANSGTTQANAIGPMCQTCPLGETQITVQWPDGNNNVGSRVRVTITSPYRPFMTTWLGAQFNLQASSTMLIAH